MKKIVLTLASLFCCAVSYAVPAHPGVVQMEQPDGTTISVKLNGDEFLHWSSTIDGYTLVKDGEGFYVYAESVDGTLVPTDVRASDVDKRMPSEVAYLSKIRKNITPAMTPESKALRAEHLSAVDGARANADMRKYDYSNFRGLVVLVEFSDCSFVRDDYKELVTDMICKENYDGYMSNSSIPQKIAMTGSVRDYFYDNSAGVFEPKFDIVGPVKLNFSMYYPESTRYIQPVVKAALNGISGEVDFSKYDADNDRVVDMIYFIFAGGGSNYQGNDSRLVWPHASSVYMQFGNVRTGRYACSTELTGPPASKVLDGIGTICHEFSHCLGLADEYDTDYEGSGGQSIDPGTWSVMAGGSYLNNSRTPCGYSLFQRYQSGFATPAIIDDEGDWTLEPIDESNTGFRINSAVEKEYFMIENRQNTKWNEYLPGHGMLVFRVDSTSSRPWANNTVNANPNHNYYELLRAKIRTYGSMVIDSDGDPFPGSGKVSVLNNYTTPHLKSWAGAETAVGISNIAEEDGVITFSTNIDKRPKEIEDFENIQPTATAVGTYKNLEGKICTWSITKGGIVEPETGNCNGKRGASLLRKGELVSGVVDYHVESLLFTVFNGTNSMCTFRCQYSVDGGATWENCKTIDGVDLLQVSSGSRLTGVYNLNLDKPAMFKIIEHSGDSFNYCVVDDVTFMHNNQSGVEDAVADLSGMKALREGEYIAVYGAASREVVNVYTLDGSLVATERAIDGVARLYVPDGGFYLVSDGTATIKVAF